MKSIVKNKILWISPVGDNPVTGGGVATAVSLLRGSGLIPDCYVNYRSLLGFSKWQQINQSIWDLFLSRNKKFILHSVFSPYSWLVLLIPLGQKVYLFPHGELKSGALCINEKKKRIIIYVIKIFSKIFRNSKKLIIVSSNKEEIEFLVRLIKVDKQYLIPDAVSKSVFLDINNDNSSFEDFNLVNITRMVPNKGVSDLFKAILKAQFHEDQGFLTGLRSIHIFFAKEDPSEEQNVKTLAQNIEADLGIFVHFYEGLSIDEIEVVLKKIPNKMPFLPSRFESFSYALLELFNSEFKPVVWFENELTEFLLSHGACICINDGDLPLKPEVYDNVDAKEKVMNNLINSTIQNYKKVFEEVLEPFN